MPTAQKIKLKIKKGDKVVVIAGKDKGKQGEVLSVSPTENRAVVGGVNIVKRHTRQTATQEGGIISKSLPIQISNLAIRDPKDGKPTRVGYKMVGDKKVRFAKRSGEQEGKDGGCQARRCQGRKGAQEGRRKVRR
jgi:large subunit ribosomal protein L24